MIFFDNKDYSGGSQDFPVTLPATGCTPCAELVRLNLFGEMVVCLSYISALTCCPSLAFEVCYLLKTLCRFGCRTTSEPTPGSHMCHLGVLPSFSLMGMAAQVCCLFSVTCRNTHQKFSIDSQRCRQAAEGCNLRLQASTHVYSE